MEYILKRSKRKTLSLQVTKDLEVLVRAPLRLSQKEIDGFVAGHQSWIEKQMEKRSSQLAVCPEPTKEELAALRELAKATIPGRVAHYAALMGLTPAGVKINAAKGRYGSCSAKNSLNFSCRLMRFPPEAIDYVVVHELAHITHKNHGGEFYKLVASVLPDYKNRKGMLSAPDVCTGGNGG